MITKNSWSTRRQVLLEVLNSSLQIPYRALILVDDGDDETGDVVRDWCDNHGKELVYSRSRLYGHPHPTRATARQTAIDIFLEGFKDEWLMFLDDDAVLRPGWWEWVEVNKVLEDGAVGEVWGINWDVDPARERLLSLFGLDLKQYLIRKFEERGGTHDTLYRRAAIEGVRIPPELHVYEDAWLHHWVRCHGWKSVINPVGVAHYHPMPSLKAEKEKLELAIRAALKYGICEYEHVRVMAGAASGSITAYLSLLRPILGLVPMLLTCTRAYGVRRGLVEAVKRQYLKLWFRWKVLRAVKDVERIPDVCEVMRSGEVEE